MLTSHGISESCTVTLPVTLALEVGYRVKNRADTRRIAISRVLSVCGARRSGHRQIAIEGAGGAQQAPRDVIGGGLRRAREINGLAISVGLCRTLSSRMRWEIPADTGLCGEAGADQKSAGLAQDRSTPPRPGCALFEFPHNRIEMRSVKP